MTEQEEFEFRARLEQEQQGAKPAMSPADAAGEGESYPNQNYTSLGPTLEVMQAPFIAKDAAMLAYKSPSIIKAGVEGIAGMRNKLAEYLAQKAAKQSFASLGSTVKQAAELGPEAQEALGRFALDKKIVGYGRSPEEMLGATMLLEKEVGSQVGGFRATAGERGAALNPDDIMSEIDSLGKSKYGPGLREGEAGGLENAKNEILKRSPSSPEEWSGVATDMNKFAEGPASILQPQEATTDVANIISRKNTAAINSALTPEEQAAYEAARGDYGQIQTAQKMLGREQGRVASGGETPFSRHGVIDKYVASPQTRASMLDKMSQILKTSPQSLGKNAGPLLSAMQRGRGALASTIFIMQQQDPDFRAQMRELSEQK